MARRPGASPEVRQRAAERQRQVLQLRIRGLSFDAIGKQLGCSQQISFKVYRKALRAIVHPAVDELRNQEYGNHFGLGGSFAARRFNPARWAGSVASSASQLQ